MLKKGDQAPVFALPAATGGEVALSETLRSHRAALLVFLRHLG